MFKKLWNHICSDWVRVMMALILALLIYVLRSDLFSTKIESRDFSDIKVKFEYPNSNIINLDNKSYTVSLTVEGSSSRIAKLTADQIDVEVEIDHNHLQNGLIELTGKNIKTPFGIRVKKINNPRLTVNLDLIVSKKVPVKVTFDSLDKLSENYSVSKCTVFPKEVMISGPKSKIDNIKEVVTSPVPLDSSIHDNFKYKANIASAAGITTAPSTVECEVIISQNFGKRTVKKIPVALIMPSDKLPALRYKLNPAFVDIEFSGPSRTVHFLTANDFDVFVNAREINKAGEYVLNVRCAPRSSAVRIISVTPVQLTLTAEDAED